MSSRTYAGTSAGTGLWEVWSSVPCGIEVAGLLAVQQQQGQALHDVWKVATEVLPEVASTCAAAILEELCRLQDQGRSGSRACGASG